MKKGIVAYDSVYGNTEKVAKAIAEQIRSEGNEVETISLKDVSPGAIVGDFMFIGSPTRIGRPTRNAKAFLEKLDASYWRTRPVVAFDTVGPFPEDPEKREKWLERVEKSAASRLQDVARGRGLKVHPEVFHAAVTGFKGPLASDALDMAKAFVHKFLDGVL